MIRYEKREITIWCRDGTTITIPDGELGFRDVSEFSDEALARRMVKRLGLKVTVRSQIMTTLGVLEGDKE